MLKENVLVFGNEMIFVEVTVSTFHNNFSLTNNNWKEDEQTESPGKEENKFLKYANTDRNAEYSQTN